MDYIILDIEFNGRKFASDLPMEVIEIGAVRLNSQLEYMNEFSALIKPVYFSKLNSFIKKKTGIPQEDIDRAPGFVKVITDFIQWLDQSEAYLLFTWGGEDLKRIVYDTRMHKLDDTYWMTADYFDLLKGYTRFKNVTNDVSVEGALLDLNITATGTAHRALDDAIMTSEVFRAIFDHLDFSYTQQYVDVYSNAKERRMVKNAIRSMTLQKIPLTVDNLNERYLKDKVSLEDPRKLVELKQYFLTELKKERQPVPASTK
ncbi:exonuclease domain-containing protein [Paenibacillus sp. CMAA1364]